MTTASLYMRAVPSLGTLRRNTRTEAPSLSLPKSKHELRLNKLLPLNSPTSTRLPRLLLQKLYSSRESLVHSYHPIGYSTHLFRQLGMQPDAKKVEELVEYLAAKLDVYEEILSKQRYLAGNVRILSPYFTTSKY
jgi:hypothetical protein